MHIEKLTKFLPVGLLMASAISGCDIPTGMRFRELSIDKITVPAVVKRGQEVTAALANVITPFGEPSATAEVDDVHRTVRFVVVEFEVQHFLNPRAYPQAVVFWNILAKFTPNATGTYTLSTRGGSATTTIEVQE